MCKCARRLSGAFLLGGRDDDRYDGVLGKIVGTASISKIDASLGQVNSLPSV